MDGQQQHPAAGLAADRQLPGDGGPALRMVEAEAGGGAVRVQVDERGRVRALHLEAAVFERRDHELLADLVLGAIAEAQRRAADGGRPEVTAGGR